MRTGLSLVDLAKKIEEQQALKRDLIVDTREAALTVQDDGVIALEVPDAQVSVRDDGRASYPVRETAHDQIGARLQIPAKYYDRMRKEAPDLLVQNVNRWFRDQPERRMIRTLAGETRGFLSDRYNRIEHEEIATVALPVLLNRPGVKIVSSEITERRLYIQAVSDVITGEVKRGDIVRAGVVISNSEIGHGAASVAAFAERLVCLNGMISVDKFSVRHVGRQVEDSEALWRDDTRQADDRAVLLKVRDMITAAFDEVQFRARIAKMTALTEGRVTGDPAKAVEVLAAKVGANETESAGILRALISGGDLSAWGLLNAVTAQAHDASSYDRAVDFEVAGGQLLDLPSTEWKKVLEAA